MLTSHSLINPIAFLSLHCLGKRAKCKPTFGTNGLSVPFRSNLHVMGNNYTDNPFITGSELIT